MKNGYDRALAPVLVHEGGYVNHPNDPGGPTNMGVTQRVYDAYRRGHHVPVRSVEAITMAEVSDIYRPEYWDAVNGDRLPPGVDYVVFDFAVNSGPARAVKTLQAALGVAADGKVGAMTLEALAKHSDHDALIADICARRMAFLRRLSTFKTFGKGWSRRVSDVQRRGQAWAMGSVGKPVEYIPGAERKARDIEAAPRPTTNAPDAGVVIGGGMAGAGSNDNVLAQAKDALEPIAGISEWAAKAFAVLTVAGLAIALGSLAWRWWKSRDAKAYDRDMIAGEGGA